MAKDCYTTFIIGWARVTKMAAQAEENAAESEVMLESKRQNTVRIFLNILKFCF